MDTPNNDVMPGPGRRIHARPSSQGSHSDARRAELLQLLLKADVPEKSEILRVKQLIRELARDGRLQVGRDSDSKDFISAYLDLYLGRITGEAAIEKAGLRRCLDLIGVPQNMTAPQTEDVGPK